MDLYQELILDHSKRPQHEGLSVGGLFDDELPERERVVTRQRVKEPDDPFPKALANRRCGVVLLRDWVLIERVWLTALRRASHFENRDGKILGHKHHGAEQSALPLGGQSVLHPGKNRRLGV